MLQLFIQTAGLNVLFGAVIWFSQCVIRHFFHSLFVHSDVISSAAAECDRRSARPDEEEVRNTHFSNFFHALSVPVTHFSFNFKVLHDKLQIRKALLISHSKDKNPGFVARMKLKVGRIRKLFRMEVQKRQNYWVTPKQMWAVSVRSDLTACKDRGSFERVKMNVEELWL